MINPPLPARAVRRAAHLAPVLAAALLALLLGAVAAPRAAHAQLNFTPLERGDVKEYDQHLVVMRDAEGKEFALQLGGDFAMRMRNEKDKALTGLDNRTQFDQDFRLKLQTWFHQDVSMVLTLQTTPASLDNANLRGEPAEDRGSLLDGKALTLTAREAYLRWNINPNSHLMFGKQEVSLGDRRGKVYDALMPGAEFDCRVGTWCMPFGAIKIGQNSADWIYNWALEYRAWDDRQNTMRQTLSVEIYRILYTEQNVPLGKNLGPGFFNSNCPDPNVSSFGCSSSDVSASQVVDQNGSPIYYDANEQNYAGLRVNWLSGPVFMNFDFNSAQGFRLYHLYRDPSGGIVGTPQYTGGAGGTRTREAVNGYSWETEMGARWLAGRTGLRYMTATGDNVTNDGSGNDFLRVLRGYHEITPGTYKGTRLYFNGGDSTVDLGGGLGHSVNNTSLVGLFLDLDYPETAKLGYQGGLYHLWKNRAVLNAENSLKSDIGIEWDNMLIWHAHKAIQLQFEANLLKANGAFAIDDFTAPDVKQNLFVQGIVRMVYSF